MLVLNGQLHRRAAQLISHVDGEFRILFNDSMNGAVIAILTGENELIVHTDYLTLRKRTGTSVVEAVRKFSTLFFALALYICLFGLARAMFAASRRLMLLK